MSDSLGRIIGQLHVGASDEEVTEHVLGILTPELQDPKNAAHRERRAAILREALQIHKRNQRFYDSMYGAGSSDLEQEITEHLYGGEENRAAMEAEDETGMNIETHGEEYPL